MSTVTVDSYIRQIKVVRKGICPSKRKGSCEPSPAPTKKQPFFFFFLIFKLSYKRKSPVTVIKKLLSTLPQHKCNIRCHKPFKTIYSSCSDFSSGPVLNKIIFLLVTNALICNCDQQSPRHKFAIMLKAAKKEKKIYCSKRLKNCFKECKKEPVKTLERKL